ncbi:MAG TPA: DNA/RNA non-specific endonuclease [Allosphingosinicella sp.]|nr:DNA/RNA non-specific endonuclease [Allosphingosinicella sp.]
MKPASLLIALAALAAPAPLFADDAEIHTYHCLHGCPMGAAETNDLIVREIYTLSSNDLTKFADWVAYRVTRDSIGPSGGRAWKADPWLADAETLEPNDYDGAPAQLKIDRGHQAPLASFSGTPQAAATNFLSNITPQKADLNQGSWVRLENAERALAQGTGNPAVYVLTGPLYEREMEGMAKANEPHRVPSGYWKVVAIESGSTIKLSSFIFDQMTPKAEDHCKMRESIAEIERRATLKLFPRLKTRNFQKLDAQLGCAQ